VEAVHEQPVFGHESRSGKKPQRLRWVVRGQRDRHVLQPGDRPERRHHAAAYFCMHQHPPRRALGDKVLDTPTNPPDLRQCLVAGPGHPDFAYLADMRAQRAGEVLGVIAYRGNTIAWADEDQAVIAERARHQKNSGR
jgi:hypothetical protein